MWHRQGPDRACERAGKALRKPKPRHDAIHGGHGKRFHLQLGFRGAVVGDPCAGRNEQGAHGCVSLPEPVASEAIGIEAASALDERVERLAAGSPDDVAGSGEDECAALRRQLDEAEGGGEERDAEVVRDGACRLEADR